MLFVDVPRKRLTVRLTAARPRLVMAIAPAGFGKSTVVRQYGESFRSRVVCDCIGILDVSDFAVHVATALAVGDDDRTSALAKQRLSALTDAATWAAFVTESWSRPAVHDYFVFENLEAVIDSIAHVELLARLLARTPTGRCVAICSRRRPPFSWHRFFAPHEVFTLGSDDLRFDRDELAELFREHGVSGGLLDDIERVSRGWPMAALLFARLAREDSLAGIIARAGAVRYDELYDYLRDQVLAIIPPRNLSILLAVAAIPNATASEIALALGEPPFPEELACLVRGSPFVYAIAPDTYEAHPLIRDALREGWSRELADITARVITRLAADSPLRAAQLAMMSGDQERAASLLDGVGGFLVDELTVETADIVARLDRDVLLRHPAIWAAATAVRATNMSDDEWLEEALVVRDNLRPDTPTDVRTGVHISLANVLSNVGRHEEAREACYAVNRGSEPISARSRAARDLMVAATYAREGRFFEAEALWNRTEPHFTSVKYSRAIMLEEVTARAARFRGQRAEERSLLETAIALAKSARNALATAFTLEEAAYAAWVAGEDQLFRRYVRELDAAVEPTTVRATEVFRATARGDFAPILRRERFEHPKMRFYAALIGSTLGTGAVRAELTAIAMDAAAEAAEPMSVAIAHIAHACFFPEARAASLAAAVDAASSVDAEAFRDAVSRVARGDAQCGMLTPLMQRLRTPNAAAISTRSAPVVVSLAQCSVRRDGAIAHLTGRERELVMFLASQPRGGRRAEEIIEAMWPQSDSGHSALRVTAQRVRRKLGRDAIIVEDGSYALGPGVAVDLHEIEAVVVRARGANVQPSLVAALEAALDQLARPRTQLATDWSWFAQVGLRVSLLRREVATLLARIALDRGDTAAVLQFTEPVIEEDPCDEPTRELRIRAYVAAGDRAAAMRELRTYRRTLLEELDAEPSASLISLLREQVAG